MSLEANPPDEIFESLQVIFFIREKLNLKRDLVLVFPEHKEMIQQFKLPLNLSWLAKIQEKQKTPL